MRKGEIAIRIRGIRFNQQDSERVAAFIKATTTLFDARFVRITPTTLVLHPKAKASPA
jgi:hypothetical protein